MGNVTSWSGYKTLSCFQYYDQVWADFMDPEPGRRIHPGYEHTNWASGRMTSHGRPGGRIGPTMDRPTCRGPFKNIETEGYLSQESPNYKCDKKGEIFKIVIQLDRNIQD